MLGCCSLRTAEQDTLSNSPQDPWSPRLCHLWRKSCDGMPSLRYSNRTIRVLKSTWDVGGTHVGELRFLAVVRLGSEARKDCLFGPPQNLRFENGYTAQSRCWARYSTRRNRSMATRDKGRLWRPLKQLRLCRGSLNCVPVTKVEFLFNAVWTLTSMP
jgi:hypothetical protein